MGIKACEFNDVIGINVLVAGLPALNNFIAGSFLEPGDKKDAFIDESFKPGKVIVPTVKDHDVSRFQRNAGGDGRFVNLAFSHDHERRQRTGMIEFDVKFNGAFGGAEFGA